MSVVLLAGEVLPTAIFTGPRQLQISASLVWVVYFLQFVLYPIAYPLSKLLNLVVGEEEDDDTYNREEISAMLQLHSEQDENSNLKISSVTGNVRAKESFEKMEQSNDTDAPLSKNECEVLIGTLELAKKSIKDVFIPLENVNMLSIDIKLNHVNNNVIQKLHAGFVKVWVRSASHNFSALVCGTIIGGKRMRRK